jgi:SulP family sulfate permease
MFILAPIMSRIPLAALAGVLMVTAWRMNEWEAIQYIFGKRFKTAITTFLITMLATITLDLTQAILIGAFLSGAVFLNQIASLTIDVQQVDVERLRQRGIETAGRCRHVQVAYLTGPLFFAATGTFNEAFAHLGDTHALILSMRGVPLLDTSGLQVMIHLHEKLAHGGGTLMVSGANEPVKRMLERGGLLAAIGPDNLFWSADQAIVAAEKFDCRHCAAELAA